MAKSVRNRNLTRRHQPYAASNASDSSGSSGSAIKTYVERPSNAKDTTNGWFATAVSDQAWRLGHYGGVVVLDGPKLSTTTNLVAAGVPCSNITVVEMNPEVHEAQAASRFAAQGVRFVLGNIYDFVQLNPMGFQAVYFDTMTNKVDGLLAALEAVFDAHKTFGKVPDLVISVTTVPHDNTGMTHKERAKLVDSGLAAMAARLGGAAACKYDYVYTRGANGTPMSYLQYTVRGAHQPEAIRLATQFRPVGFFRPAVCPAGHVLVKWGGYPKPEDWTVEPEAMVAKHSLRPASLNKATKRALRQLGWA